MLFQVLGASALITFLFATSLPRAQQTKQI
jgi:hypothetical protein